jgi:hypothetical protein
MFRRFRTKRPRTSVASSVVKGPWFWLAILFLIFSHTYWTQDLTSSNRASMRPHGDGQYYFIYLRSMMFDGDFDFKNDYRLIGNQYGFGTVRKTGRPKNLFSIGPAIYWLPFAAVGQAYCYTGTKLGYFIDPLDGTSLRFQKIVFFGSVFWGFAAMVLVVLFLRRRYGNAIATTTAIALVVASPLGWYILRQASFSHAISAFTVTAFVLYWEKTFLTRTGKQWAYLGFLLGLSMLVRSQDMTHVLLPLAEWVYLAYVGSRQRDFRGLRLLVIRGCIFVVAILLAFSPQMVAWQVIFGYPVTIPLGKDFMQWKYSVWSEVLFSSRQGLFSWTPILYVSVIGLFCLAFYKERKPLLQAGPLSTIARHRAVSALLFIGFAAQLYINGCPWDWWGGWAYGGRRFMSSTVYFAAGLGFFLFWLRGFVRRHGRFFIAATPVVFVALFAIFNLSLMDDYLNGKAYPDRNQLMQPRYEAAMLKVSKKLYKTFGNLGSAPVNWIFALRSGGSFTDFDAVYGYELFFRRTKETLELNYSQLALGGFGKKEARFFGRRARFVSGKEAVIALPMRKPLDIRATLTLRPVSWGKNVPKTHVRLSIGGHPLLATTLKPGWNSYSFKIPHTVLSAGMNLMRAEQTIEKAPTKWPIGRSGKVSPVEISVQSAGFFSGKTGVFHFGDQKVVVKKPGAVAYVLDGDGKPKKLGIYKSHRRNDESLRFADDIKGLEDGTVVVFAAVDDASKHWTPQANKALWSIGGNLDFRGKFRSSYALIGVKGAKRGQSVEKFDRRKRVQVRIGRDPKKRHYGVAWGALSMTVNRKDLVTR